MIVYIFTLVLLCETFAHESRLEHCDVGTVLFPRSALYQRSWTAPQLGLLRARKHFLDIIPPVHVLNTRNEDFTNTMLAYFKETFQVVNKEATDHETNMLLKLALCDTVGGYLKMWILPITKFAYYGGTVPKEDALKLYNLHNEIKRYLNTDGKGWRNPSSSFLYSMSVHIAPLRQDMTRKSQNPCHEIAYFEKTNNGLAIPVPSISWEQGSECMFLPIKELGPVPLNTPDSSNKLFHYYNIAKRCISASGIESIENYEERLQKWLDYEVVTHLSDERLYPALYSVLSLVNKSRNLFDIDEDPHISLRFRNKTHIAGIPLDLSSKKMMVITIIIILEIAWCIPTLCYLMCSRMKKKKRKSDTVCYNIETVHRKDDDSTGGDWQGKSSQCVTTTTIDTRGPSKLISACPSKQSRACLSMIKSHDVNIEAYFPKSSEHSIGTTTHSDFTCQLHPIQIKSQDRSVSRISSKHFPAPLATASTPANISVSTREKTPVARPCWKRSVYSSTPSKISESSLAPFGFAKKSSSFIKTCKCDCRSASSSNIKPCGCECQSQSSFTKPCKCDCDSTSFIKTCCGTSKKLLTSQEVKAYRVDPKKTTTSFHKTCCESNCECFKSIPEEELISGSGSIITIQSLQPTQTVTLLHGSISSTVKHSETFTDKDCENNLIELKRSKKNVTIADLSSTSLQLDRVASRNMSKEMQSLAIEKSSKQTMKYSASKSNRTSSESETKCLKKDPKTTSKALLEITIDRQRLRSLPKQTSCVPETPIKVTKLRPSKIPKRFFASCVTQTLFPPTRAKPETNRRSLIPQPKRHLTVDDIVIKSSKPNRKEVDKLNVTL